MSGGAAGDGRTLPEGWSRTTTDTLTCWNSPICYGVLKPGEWQTGGVPLVRVTDIRRDEFDTSRMERITNDLDEEFARSRIRPGDVLISVQGTVGKVAVVPKDIEPSNISRTIARIRLQQGLNPAWLRYTLLSPQAQDIIAGEVGGTTRASLNIKELRLIELPLPPLAEQARIVAKLDCLTERSREARAALDRVPALLDRARQAVLAAAFAEAAELAQLEPLGDHVESVKAGKNLRCTERPPRADERGVVKVSAVTYGWFDASQSKTFPDDYDPDPGSLIRSGDLLFSRANTIELVGAVAVVEDPPSNLYLSDKVLRLEIAADLRAWTYHFLRSPAGRAQIESLATGAQNSMRNISQKNLKRVALPIPVSQEREPILARLDAALSHLGTLADAAARARADLDRLDRAVLAKAFRGELVPQDPSDEPAARLLERVKAARDEARETRARTAAR